MRWLCAILGLTLLWLQGYLWLSDSGHRNTRDIRQSSEIVRVDNERLRLRNAALAAEVKNLKTSFEATEERARTDLGMIGARETFYQVVPAERTGS